VSLIFLTANLKVGKCQSHCNQEAMQPVMAAIHCRTKQAAQPFPYIVWGQDNVTSSRPCPGHIQ